LAGRHASADVGAADVLATGLAELARDSSGAHVSPWGVFGILEGLRIGEEQLESESQADWSGCLPVDYRTMAPGRFGAPESVVGGLERYLEWAETLAIDRPSAPDSAVSWADEQSRAIVEIAQQMLVERAECIRELASVFWMPGAAEAVQPTGRHVDTGPSRRGGTMLGSLRSYASQRLSGVVKREIREAGLVTQGSLASQMHHLETRLSRLEAGLRAVDPDSGVPPHQPDSAEIARNEAVE
jgi:hypothetical protein